MFCCKLPAEAPGSSCFETGCWASAAYVVPHLRVGSLREVDRGWSASKPGLQRQWCPIQEGPLCRVHLSKSSAHVGLACRWLGKEISDDLLLLNP
eukprot:8430223-Pyramimonas_sp.AAC.1